MNFHSARLIVYQCFVTKNLEAFRERVEELHESEGDERRRREAPREAVSDV